MADSEQSEHATAVRHKVRSLKQIVGYEERDNPELEPLFANNFELILIGSDLYMDIGIVKPQDILDLKPKIERAPSEEHSVTFHVLQRIAMSKDGFERLKAGVDNVSKAMKEGENG